MKAVKISFVFNTILVILSVIGAVKSFQSHGAFSTAMVYYTQDSNIFLGLSALIYTIALIRILRRKDGDIPIWVRRIKYYSVCCISVTLFVVLFILAPMAESLGGLRWILFTDSMLYQHTLSPVIAIVGFLLFEKKPELAFRETLFALIPTLIYAAVIYPLNILEVVDGPYPFLQVHNMSPAQSIMWLFIVFALSYGLALLIWFCNKKIPGVKEHSL